MLTLLQTTGNPPLTVLFAILGVAVVGLCTLAVGTWSGSARAAYLRRYNKAHGTNLPAGLLEEGTRQWMLDQDARELDLFRVHRQARRQQQAATIWPTLYEPQSDPELERLRRRAEQRSSISVILYSIMVAVGFMVAVFIGTR